eukprot:TRINITY_DN6840_c0_g1_i1.p1 TRINITY_DN6840_c0_g1~~TRINITY_DN6840_c0_g1_i1.p1  ORF type:complete len:399 (+),score=89.14 TRINITY_DN6840_c0_g1_i1:100-1296(+)
MSFIALLESVSEREVRRLEGGTAAVSLQQHTESRPSISEPCLWQQQQQQQQQPASVIQQRFEDARACHVQSSFTGKHASEPESQASCQAQPLEHSVNENRPTHSQCASSHEENSRTCTNTGIIEPRIKEPGEAHAPVGAARTQPQTPVCSDGDCHGPHGSNKTPPQPKNQQDSTDRSTTLALHGDQEYSASHTENHPDSLEILAEEERMRRIHAEKARAQAERSMALQAKAQKTKERAQDLQERKRAENEQKLLELELRMEVATGRREEDLKLRRIRAEERRLRLADAQAEKNRIARLDGYRRERLQAQIDAKQERLELFLALTDEFRDQRKQKTCMGTAPRLNFIVDALPGPGQYDAPPSTIATARAPKISTSRSTSVFEKFAGVTHANPPPGACFV